MFFDRSSSGKDWKRPLFGGQHDLVAQRFQLAIGDPAEFHAQVENGDRHQLRRIVLAAGAERSTAFLQRGQHGKQLFV